PWKATPDRRDLWGPVEKPLQGTVRSPASRAVGPARRSPLVRFGAPVVLGGLAALAALAVVLGPGLGGPVGALAAAAGVGGVPRRAGEDPHGRRDHGRAGRAPATAGRQHSDGHLRAGPRRGAADPDRCTGGRRAAAVSAALRRRGDDARGHRLPPRAGPGRRR